MINVIDSGCGTGKTSWAIDYMKSNPNKKFIFVTPMRTEIDRITKCTNGFKTPMNKGENFLPNFNYLIEHNNNVVVTHETFKKANAVTSKLLTERNYVLIIDEALDVVHQFKDIEKNDFQLLRETKRITINENRYIQWNNELQYDKGKFLDFKLSANNGNLIYVDKSNITWNFPPYIFHCFKEIYILTYLFSGQPMKYYFNYYGIGHELLSVEKDIINGTYRLKGYDFNDEIQFRKTYGKLINIYEGSINYNNKRGNSLSKKYYQNLNEEGFNELKNNLYNYLNNKVRASAKSVMWSTYEDYYTKLKPRGYSQFYSPDVKNKDAKIKNITFLACNARATNDYKDRYNLAYLCNRYPSPMLSDFFETKGIQMDANMFALSELLQWAFRSRIRNQEPINIYVPSFRMRNLLNDWKNAA